MMHLVRDVLDKRLLDRDGTIIGRVDGLIIETDGSSQPRVTGLTIGGPPLFARIGQWAVSLAKFLGAHWGPKRRSSVHIPWSEIDHFGRDVKLTISCRDNDAMAWESWIDNHIIMKIPGGGSK